MTNSITGFNIAACEKKYNAKYVGDFPVKLANGNWGGAGAVFYTDNPDRDKGHKNLFGLFWDSFRDTAVIYDASYLEDHHFTGVMLDDGLYAWSRSVHDFREVPGGALDGGFDYLHVIGQPKLVNLHIVKGKVVPI